MAATITRLNLRDNVRYLLQQWPVIALPKKTITVNDNSVNVEDTDLREMALGRGLLEVGSEVMLILGHNKNATSLRVVRGYQGSTKVEHSVTAEIKIHAPGSWTDRELNLKIAAAIRWLKPSAWTEALSATFTWSSLDYVATVPSASGISFPDGNYLHTLEYLDSGSSRYFRFDGWQLRGTTLHFRDKSGSDRTLRCRYASFQGQLSADASTLDNDDFAEAIEHYAAHLALVAIGSNRVRYTEYAAALNDRSSTPDELIRMSFNLRNLAIQARDNAHRPMPSGYVSTYRSATPS